MSKETRTIRPFTGIGAIATALDTAVVHFGPDRCLANDTLTAELEPHEFMLRPVSIEWASDDESFNSFRKQLVDAGAAAGFHEDDLLLVVAGSSSFLRVTDVISTVPLAELDGLSRIIKLTEPNRLAVFCTPFTGFLVDIYLVLARNLPMMPIRPFRRGTWLARARYRVETSAGPGLLPPTPLTDEIRAHLRLAPKTIRFVAFGDHDVLQPYAQQERPIFYVDEKILANLNARRTARVSRALQVQLALDFVSAVIYHGSISRDLSEVGYDDLRQTLLGNILRLAGGPGATDEDLGRLLQATQSDPQSVVARAEHQIDVLGGYTAIFNDEEVE